MAEKIAIHPNHLKNRIKGIKDLKISEEDKKDLVKFLDELALGKVNKGKKISDSRRIKYLDMLQIPLKYFNKPTSKLTLKDVEKFEKYICKKKYAHSTLITIRLMFRAYLKWKLGDTEHFRELTDWFDLKDRVKTPDYLKEEEINKLFKACKTNEERYLIAVLFDCGCRAEEFYNVRMEDIELPNENKNYCKIHFKEEYSKTLGRNISLYWSKSLEAVKDYYEERKKEGVKSEEQIFKASYDNTRQFLVRLGKKVLNKRVHFHLFRHSSATYYASNPSFNRQQLCYRYGWKFSSDMPDVYISRAGMVDNELSEKFESTELQEVKQQLEQQKQQQNIEIDKLKNRIQKDYYLFKESKEQLEEAKELFEMILEKNKKYKAVLKK